MASVSYQIANLLEKMTSNDKDFRFMATNDLMTELQKDSIKLDDDSERKVVKMLLRLLEDKNGEVQNLAVKCLGPLVNKVKEYQVEAIVDTLCANMLSETEQLRDISSIGLKTVISELPLGSNTLAANVCKKITGRLSSAIEKQEDVSVQLEALDILADLLSRFGGLLISFHPMLLNSLLPQLASPRQAVRKRTIVALSHLVMSCSADLYKKLIDHLLEGLSASTSPSVTRTHIQCIASICRQAGHRFGEQLDRVAPQVLEHSTKADEELREHCLQALEAFVLKCPKEVQPHIATVRTISLAATNQLDRVASQVLEHSTKADEELREHCLQALEAFVLKCPKEVQPHIATVRTISLAATNQLDRVASQVLEHSTKADEELREHCLQALEAFVLKCPKEVQPHIATALEAFVLKCPKEVQPHIATVRTISLAATNQLDRVASQVLEHSTKADEELREHCLQALEAFVLKCPKEVQPHIATADEELREHCLQALEAFVLKCPKEVQPHIATADEELREHCLQALEAFVLKCPKEVQPHIATLDSLAPQVLDHSTKADEELREHCLQALEAFVLKCPKEVQPHIATLDSLAPQVLEHSTKADEELREHCLQALEAFVLKCPKEVQPHIATVRTTSLAATNQLDRVASQVLEHFTKAGEELREHCLQALEAFVLKCPKEVQPHIATVRTTSLAATNQLDRVASQVLEHFTKAGEELREHCLQALEAFVLKCPKEVQPHIATVRTTSLAATNQLDRVASQVLEHFTKAGEELREHCLQALEAFVLKCPKEVQPHIATVRTTSLAATNQLDRVASQVLEHFTKAGEELREHCLQALEAFVLKCPKEVQPHIATVRTTSLAATNQLDRVASQVLEHFTKAGEELREHCLQALEAFVLKCPKEVQPHIATVRTTSLAATNQLDSLAPQVLEHSTKADEELREHCLQALEAFVLKCPKEVQPHIATVRTTSLAATNQLGSLVLQVLEHSTKADEELREHCLQALEAFLLKCPKEVQPHIATVKTFSYSNTVTTVPGHGPLCSQSKLAGGGEDEDMEDDSAPPDAEPDSDSEEYSDDDDMSWKVSSSAGYMQDSAPPDAKPDSDSEEYSDDDDMSWKVRRGAGYMQDSAPPDAEPDSDSEEYSDDDDMSWKVSRAAGYMQDSAAAPDAEPDSDSEEYSDDDDMSWKVRRAAAKCLESVISTRHELLPEMYQTVSPALIARFKEREENVKCDILSAYTALLRATRPPPALQMTIAVNDNSPQAMLKQRVPGVVKGALRVIRGRSVRARGCALALLRELLTCAPGCLTSHAERVIRALTPALTDKSTASSMKIETLVFIVCLLRGHPAESMRPHVAALMPAVIALRGHPAESMRPHVAALMPAVIACVHDPFYKVTAEALRVLQTLVKVIRPLDLIEIDGQEPRVAPPPEDLQRFIPDMYQCTLVRLRATDMDQEVKERAIAACGQLLCHFGDLLQNELPYCLPIFLERLRNEITRLTTVKALTKVAASPLRINLSPIMSDAVPILGSFLRKNQRALKLSTLVLLDTLVQNYSQTMSIELLSKVLMEVPPLICEQDLHCAQTALTLVRDACLSCPLALTDDVRQALTPNILALANSPLLQGGALKAMLGVLSALVSADVAGCSRRELLALLVAPVHRVHEHNATAHHMKQVYPALKALLGVLSALVSADVAGCSRRELLALLVAPVHRVHEHNATAHHMKQVYPALKALLGVLSALVSADVAGCSRRELLALLVAPVHRVHEHNATAHHMKQVYPALKALLGVLSALVSADVAGCSRRELLALLVAPVHRVHEHNATAHHMKQVYPALKALLGVLSALVSADVAGCSRRELLALLVAPVHRVHEHNATAHHMKQVYPALKALLGVLSALVSADVAGCSRRELLALLVAPVHRVHEHNATAHHMKQVYPALKALLGVLSALVSADVAGCSRRELLALLVAPVHRVHEHNATAHHMKQALLGVLSALVSADVAGCSRRELLALLVAPVHRVHEHNATAHHMKQVYPALKALLGVLSALVSADVAGCSRRELLALLVAPVHRVHEHNATAHHMKQAFHSLAKCVGAVVAEGGEEAFDVVRGFLRDAERPPSDAHHMFALLALAEIGKHLDLSGIPNLKEVLLNSFTPSSEEVKSAASYALGSVAVGNLPKFLPFILQQIEAQPKRQYLLLHSLREIISCESCTPEGVEALRPFIPEIWVQLSKHCQCNEEGSRNVVAECLGKLCLLEPQTLLPHIKEFLKSPEPLTRTTAVTAVKFTISDQPQAIDPLLRSCMSELLVPLRDPELGVRRVALVAFNSAAHNKPSLIRDLLPQVLPTIYSETKVKKELIREVEMGPFKHSVDDGLDLRKAAFECMYTLLGSCLDRLDVFEFLRHVEDGLRDHYDIKMLTYLMCARLAQLCPAVVLQRSCLDRLDVFEFLRHVEDGLRDHYDIKMLTYLMCARLAQLCPAVVLQRLESLVEPLRATCTMKVKANSVKQEYEKQDELKRSALRAAAALLQIPEAEKNPHLNDFVNQIKLFPDLQPIFESILKDQSGAGVDSNLMDQS
ncbi:TATA-binding protein interacting (TIP20) domain-containing protein [Phthorimaea operculella]|nr:TATA-binding protein interacting (TIP20) domain-containing protein [Phthorimaea operculella]